MPAFKTENFIFGAGKIYVDQFTAAGAKQGERYVGNAPSLTVTTRAEVENHVATASPIRSVDATIQTRITRTGRLILYNLSEENLAMFLGGTVTTVTQTATPVVNEAITVLQGYYYQIGRTGANYVGARGIASVTVTGVGGTPTYTLGTDYTIDLASALIYIVPGGAIADSTTLHIDYTPTANTRKRIATSTGRFQGTLRFVPDNPAGDNATLYATNCTMRANGDVEFLGTDWASLSFELVFNDPTDPAQAALYIDGEPV